MKIKELKSFDKSKLVEQLHESRFDLAKERAASEIGTAKNPGRIRTLRKTIARILTLMNAQQNKEIKK